MWNFKKLFSDRTSEKQKDDREGDYAVRKNKRTDILARVLSILAAFLLWAYVATTTTTTEERSFSLVPVTYREESVLKSEYGLIVQSINIDTLNVTLMGSKNDMRSLTASDVKAYINLGSITEAGEYTLDVYVDVPSGTTCVSKTVDQVVVSVDKPSTKAIPLSTEKVSLSGWSLEKDCFFGEISLSAEQVVLEGPTLELEKVSDVEVRTDVIGSAGSSFTATATVHFLDSEGNELTVPAVNVQGGTNLRVSVEVLKTKKVKLKLIGQNGYLSDDLVTLTPAYVLLTGEPEQVNEIGSEWEVGSIDEKTLKGDDVRTYQLELAGIKITDEADMPISAVTAVIQVSSLPTRTLSDVPVYRGDEIVGYITMDVRAVSSADSAKLQSLTVDKVTVYSGLNSPLGDLSAMIVSFEEPFRGAVYEFNLYGFQEVS